MPIPSPGPRSPHERGDGKKSGGYRAFEPPGRFGWGFNPDKGTLTFFTPMSVRTYRADSPACWFRSDGHPQWCGCFGGDDFEIGHLAATTRRLLARHERAARTGQKFKLKPGLESLKSFYERLDPEAAALTERMWASSWLLYCLLVRAPAVRDIARDNIGLATLMALSRRNGRQRFDRTARLARRKRVEIVGACGLPAQKQWVKLLTRIPPSSASTATLHRLTELARVAPACIERLRHLPLVNGAVIALLHRGHGEHVHASLLEEVVSDRFWSRRFGHYRYRSEGLLSDTIRMLQSLDERVPLFRSMRQLERAHNDAVQLTIERGPVPRLANRGRSKGAYAPRTGPFGPPPLPDSDTIVALRSPSDLRAEAIEQHNCLAARYWADDCYDGDLYIYRILAPERASVALKRQSNGAWVPYEFKASHNRQPKPVTLRAVNKWLQQSRRLVAEAAANRAPAPLAIATDRVDAGPEAADDAGAQTADAGLSSLEYLDVADPWDGLPEGWGEVA